MQKFILGIASIATFCSMSYLSLIIYDMSAMVSKSWGHDQLLFLQSSTVLSVVALIVATSFVSYFIKSNSKKIFIGLNLILLLVWGFLLGFEAIGIIS